MSKTFRKKHLAERYSRNPRTIERMCLDGRLPPPDFWVGRSPHWYEQTIVDNEKQALARPQLHLSSSPEKRKTAVAADVAAPARDGTCDAPRRI
jgi:hypothetical protein